MKAEVLLAGKSILGEGAWYDWERDALLWLDIFGREIHVYDVRTNTDVSHKVNKPVTTIVPTKSGYILGTTDGVEMIDHSFNDMTPYISPDYDYSNYRCNDGKCGPDGRFWIGIMELSGKPGMGALYAIDGKSCELMLQNLDVPNGIVWDSSKGKMYFTDTLRGEVCSYDYKNGKVSNPDCIFKAGNGMTDGMTIDENGNIWVAVWGSGTIYNIDPDKKEIICTVETSAPQVSSVAICNGKLYITSATSGMSPEDLKKYPDSGSLFIADVPVKGIEAYRYLY